MIPIRYGSLSIEVSTLLKLDPIYSYFTTTIINLMELMDTYPF